MATRKRLGGMFFGGFMLVSGSTGLRSTVYDLNDRLEIEERDHWMISRRRIPLRDVVLITRHRYRRIGSALTMLIPTLFFGLIAGFAGGVGNHLWIGLMIGLMIAAPFLLAMLWFLLVEILEIQIQSRRVTARMRFGLRSARGELLCKELEARVRAAQAHGPSPATYLS
jgi:hypothetical protein